MKYNRSYSKILLKTKKYDCTKIKEEGFVTGARAKQICACILSMGLIVLGILSPLTQGNSDAAIAYKAIDLNGTYHATVGIQTANVLWLTRKGYYAKVTGTYGNEDVYGTDAADHLYDQGKKKSYTSTFNDAVIQGNGTYTVSLDGAEFSGERTIAQLYVSTDIPCNNVKKGTADVKFSNLIVTIDGKQVVTFDTPYMENTAEGGFNDELLKSGVDLVAINHWRYSLVETLKQKGINEESVTVKDDKGEDVTLNNGPVLLSGTGTESISLTFTVTGFNYNKDGSPVIQTPTASAVTTTSSAVTSTDTNSDDTVKNGSVKKVGDYKFEVLNNINKTVSLKKVINKKSESIIPGTVNIAGSNYKVTAIGAKAFMNDKKLTKVKIGKNVATIGSQAFKNCKKLKKINLKGNNVLSKVSKNSFSGVTKKKCILADKKNKSKYTKLCS